MSKWVEWTTEQMQSYRAAHDQVDRRPVRDAVTYTVCAAVLLMLICGAVLIRG